MSFNNKLSYETLFFTCKDAWLQFLKTAPAFTPAFLLHPTTNWFSLLRQKDSTIFYYHQWKFEASCATLRYPTVRFTFFFVTVFRDEIPVLFNQATSLCHTFKKCWSNLKNNFGNKNDLVPCFLTRWHSGKNCILENRNGLISVYEFQLPAFFTCVVFMFTCCHTLKSYAVLVWSSSYAARPWTHKQRHEIKQSMCDLCSHIKCYEMSLNNLI